VVDVAAVVNVADLDGAGSFIDGVDDAKLTPPGTETTGVLAMQRLPDPLRVLQQWASDELSGGQGNLFGEVLLGSASRGRHPQLVGDSAGVLLTAPAVPGAP